MINKQHKKAMTAVVATSLLIVVTVATVVGFQTWFGSFSSKTFVNVEQNSEQADSSSQIETLVGDELYFKNNLEENLTIKEIKVNGKVCNISITNLSLGVEAIALENCTDNLTTNIADVTIMTDKQIFNKKIFLKDVEIVKSEVLSQVLVINKSEVLVTATSNEAGFPPANTLDKDTATRWSSGGGVSLATKRHILFNLTNKYYIKNVSVIAGEGSYNSNPVYYKYYIERSIDNINWKYIYNLDTENYGKITYPVNDELQYVRVTYYGSNDWASWVNLKEIYFNE